MAAITNFFLNFIRRRFPALVMIIFLLSNNSVVGQLPNSNKVIDSLKKELGRQSENDKKRLAILNFLSISYRKIAPDSSMHYAKKSLEIATKLKSEAQKGDALQNLGIAYFYANDFKKSLDFLYQALKIREKMSDSDKVGLTLNSIGNVYYNLNNFPEAIKYYKRALSIARKVGDRKKEASILNNMGSLYGSNDRIDSAYILLNQSIILLEDQHDSPTLSSSYNNLAMLYRKNGAYEKSLQYDQKALKINEAMGRKWEISYISNSIGETFLLMKNSKKAFEYFTQALRIAETLQNQDILLFSYRSMTKYYSATGNYAKFDEYFNQYEATKDAIFTNQNTNSIAEMQVKYETERKEKENALQKLQIAKERSLKNSFIYLSILVLIVVVVLFFRFMAKKKLNSKLEILVKKRTQDLLINQLKLKEAQRIGKSGSWDWDLVKNELSWSDQLPVILGKTKKEISWISILRSMREEDRPKLVNILRRNFNDFDSHLVFDFRIIADNNTEKYINVSAEITKDSLGKILLVQGNIQDITDRKQMEQRILRNTIETEERERQRFSEDLHDGLGPLLSTAKIYLELIAARLEKPTEQQKFIKMADDLLQESIKSTREIANNLTPNLLNDFGLIEALRVYGDKINKMNTISVMLNIDENFPTLPKQTEVALYRIISELLNNTLKHASASKMEIELLKLNNQVKINYSDNGIGCDIQKILLSPSKGLGLSNVTSRVKSINGNCIYQSVPGKFFRADITLSLTEENEKMLQNH